MTLSSATSAISGVLLAILSMFSAVSVNAAGGRVNSSRSEICEAMLSKAGSNPNSETDAPQMVTNDIMGAILRANYGSGLYISRAQKSDGAAPVGAFAFPAKSDNGRPAALVIEGDSIQGIDSHELELKPEFTSLNLFYVNSNGKYQTPISLTFVRRAKGKVIGLVDLYSAQIQNGLDQVRVVAYMHSGRFKKTRRLYPNDIIVKFFDSSAPTSKIPDDVASPFIVTPFSFLNGH